MRIYRQVFFTGRVQGVGFRYATKQIASGYEVVGWVRNLSDGRVELQVGGDANEVESFLGAMADSQLARQIKETQQVELPTPTPAWTGFEIRG